MKPSDVVAVVVLVTVVLAISMTWIVVTHKPERAVPVPAALAATPFNEVATNLCAQYGGVKKIDGTGRSTTSTEWILYRVDATCVDGSTVSRMEWRSE